jgi:hypothetical protein
VTQPFSNSQLFTAAQRDIFDALTGLQQHGFIYTFECTDAVADTWVIRFDTDTVRCDSAREVTTFVYGIVAGAKGVANMQRPRKIRTRLRVRS